MMRSRTLVRTFVPAHAIPYLLDAFGLTCSVERKKERKKERKNAAASVVNDFRFEKCK